MSQTESGKAMAFTEEISAGGFMKKKVILVADDDTDLNELVCSMLNGAGYETASAFDGRQAVDMALERPPDLVLLDIMMPRMDGIEACKLLSRDDATKMIPIIMLTVKSGLSPKLSSYIAGARKYMTKPFEMDELIAEVHKILK